MFKKGILLFFMTLFSIEIGHACSVAYYIDKETGKIYVANNEDFWYDVEAYIQIIPESNKKFARLWYGWDDFAQGGVNQHGLFFDGAVTPEQKPIKGSKKIKGNLGDHILANCKNVNEAIAYVQKRKIALVDAHIMFGDSSGNAVVMEWVNGKERIVPIKDKRLVMTNFLLADTSKGNYPCPRYDAIEKELVRLQHLEEPSDLKKVGNSIAKAVQVPFTNNEGRTGGTLYSTFINLSDMEFVLVHKLNNSKITKLDLRTEFENSTKRKIPLD